MVVQELIQVPHLEHPHQVRVVAEVVRRRSLDLVVQLETAALWARTRRVTAMVQGVVPPGGRLDRRWILAMELTAMWPSSG